jgi:hypothetical protein
MVSHKLYQIRHPHHPKNFPSVPELVPTFEELTMTNKKSYVVLEGQCGADSQSMVLGWKKPNTDHLRNVALEFNKTTEGAYKWSSISTKYTLNNVTYKFGTTKIGLVTIPKDASLKCFTGRTYDLELVATENEPADQSISYKFEEVKMTISNFRLQAFADVTNEEFSDSVIECWFGWTYSYRIAKIVSFVVIGVMFFVVSTWCCKRSRKMDYED